MLPTRTVEKILATIPHQMQEIVLELRNLVVKVAPDATEKIQPRGFSYFFKQRGGPVSAGICQISILPDHIRLGFVHGAFLPDPRKLMTGKTYPLRYICIYSYETADWDYYQELVRLSASFDPRTLGFQ